VTGSVASDSHFAVGGVT